MQGNDITTYSFYLFGPPLSFRLSFERKDFCAERSLSLSSEIGRDRFSTIVERTDAAAKAEPINRTIA